MQKCRVCKKEKEDSEFYNSINTKNKCKQCYADYYQKTKNTVRAKWEENNRDKINEYKKKYNLENKEKLKQQTKDRYDNLSIEEKKIIFEEANIAHKKRMENPEYRKEWNRKRREQRQNNIEEVKRKRNIRLRKKYKEDINYRLSIILRTTFYKAIKRKQGKKEKSIFKIIGCDQSVLKEHLEKQFKPEMNWGNHGLVWEIDHILPISSFNLLDLEEQKRCFNYSNLQPLFKTTEIAKSFGYNEIGNHNKSAKIL